MSFASPARAAVPARGAARGARARRRAAPPPALPGALHRARRRSPPSPAASRSGAATCRSRCFALALAALALVARAARADGRGRRSSAPRSCSSPTSRARCRRPTCSPTRLEAARQAALSFLDKVPDELRVGLVTFSDVAQTLQTPTTDHDAVAQRARHAAADLRHGDRRRPAHARSTTSKVRGDRSARRPPAAIVLLSDGSATDGAAADIVAAEAERLRVPIYTVALGTPDGTITLRGQTLQRPARPRGAASGSPTSPAARRSAPRTPTSSTPSTSGSARRSARSPRSRRSRRCSPAARCCCSPARWRARCGSAGACRSAGGRAQLSGRPRNRSRPVAALGARREAVALVERERAALSSLQSSSMRRAPRSPPRSIARVTSASPTPARRAPGAHVDVLDPGVRRGLPDAEAKAQLQHAGGRRVVVGRGEQEVRVEVLHQPLDGGQEGVLRRPVDAHVVAEGDEQRGDRLGLVGRRRARRVRRLTRCSCVADHREDVAAAHRVALGDRQLGDHARLVRGDLVLHLHRLDDRDDLALLDLLARPAPGPSRRCPASARRACRRRAPSAAAALLARGARRPLAAAAPRRAVGRGRAPAGGPMTRTSNLRPETSTV